MYKTAVLFANFHGICNWNAAGTITLHTQRYPKRGDRQIQSILVSALAIFLHFRILMINFFLPRTGFTYTLILVGRTFPDLTNPQRHYYHQRPELGLPRPSAWYGHRKSWMLYCVLLRRSHHRGTFTLRCRRTLGAVRYRMLDRTLNHTLDAERHARCWTCSILVGR